MSDAPILGPINLVTDLETASDFEKKHTPHIEVHTPVNPPLSPSRSATRSHTLICPITLSPGSN